MQRVQAICSISSHHSHLSHTALVCSRVMPIFFDPEINKTRSSQLRTRFHRAWLLSTSRSSLPGFVFLAIYFCHHSSPEFLLTFFYQKCKTLFYRSCVFDRILHSCMQRNSLFWFRLSASLFPLPLPPSLTLLLFHLLSSSRSTYFSYFISIPVRISWNLRLGNRRKNLHFEGCFLDSNTMSLGVEKKNSLSCVENAEQRPFENGVLSKKKHNPLRREQNF